MAKLDMQNQIIWHSNDSKYLNYGRQEPIFNYITLYPQLFKLDLVMMSIVILCILSAVLYQGSAWLEKKFS